jgi:cytochrome c oxidase cbb3-type subunit 3
MFITSVILLSVIFVLGKIVKTLIEEDTASIWRKRKSGTMLIWPLLLLSSSAFAQDAAPAVQGPSMTFGMESTIFWLMMGILIFEFIALLVLCNVLYVFLVRKELIKPFGSMLPKWLQFNAMMGNDIPLEKDAELLTDHDYDGIQELDNGMPPFLKYMFIFTILFAVYYWVDYHVIEASPLQIQEYENQLAQGEAEKAEYIKKAGALVDENSVKVVDDPGVIAQGEKIYATNCVACHGDKGQGGVGPNFTDNYWIHGGDIKSLFSTIKYGVPAKGMRSWQSEIKPGDIQAVSSFILTKLVGTNVAGGKEPQGVIYDAAANATTITNDSTTVVNTTDSTKK